MADETSTQTAVELATELTIAWLGNPNTRVNSEEIPAFLQRMHDAVRGLADGGAGTPAEEAAPEYTPATTARRSLASKDHIISMIDGKPYKTLRRHLSTHGLTPAEYRQRYGLKADYPMVAPTYSEARRSMAQKIGLGRRMTARAEGSNEEGAQPQAPARIGRKAGEGPAKAPARRGRKPKEAPAE